jgi:DNA repair protein RadD
LKQFVLFTRLCEVKKYSLILDHAGNVLRHGFKTDSRPACIDGMPKLKEKPPKIFTCEYCFAIIETFPCGLCGKKPAPEAVRKRLIEVEHGLLREIEREKAFKNISEIQVKAEIHRLTQICHARGYKRGWIYHRLEGKSGPEIAKKYCVHARASSPRS